MKYMGSKARISKDVAPIINKLIEKNNINTYIEPFVGGANMIQHIRCKKKIGSDINKYLINMWNCLKDGWQPPTYITKEMYNDIKQNKEQYGDALVAIAGFCATYNAKWFGGYAGVVHTKAGTTRNYYKEAIRNIQKQLFNLHDVDFINEDYEYFSNVHDALIYCDPPYQGRTSYGYDKSFDHERFWNWIRDLSIHNIVLISEYNAPKDFQCIYQTTLTTTLDKNSRKKDTEKLFMLNTHLLN